jgi:hypothetical protein
LEEAFGFIERVQIDETHRSQLSYGGGTAETFWESAAVRIPASGGDQLDLRPLGIVDPPPGGKSGALDYRGDCQTALCLPEWSMERTEYVSTPVVFSVHCHFVATQLRQRRWPEGAFALARAPP